jgi:chemotaxis protein MotB
MLRALYTGASGMSAQEMNLDNVANNLANSSTAGYPAAQLDKRRAGKLATAIQTAFQQYGSLPPKPAEVGGLAEHGIPSLLPVGNTEPDDFDLLRKQVENALSGEIAGGEVAVRVTHGGLVISLREVGFFDSGSADIRPSSRPAFDRLAAVLQNANTDLRIEGHTDIVPIRNARFASNWDLSTARATATVRLLMSKYNFPPERLARPVTLNIARSPATTLPMGAR